MNRKYLKDRAGKTYGILEHDTVSGRIVAKDPSGRTLGEYQERNNQTRNARGTLIGEGDQTQSLFD